MDNKTEIIRSSVKQAENKERWEQKLSCLEWTAGIAFCILTIWFIVELFVGNKSNETNTLFGNYGDLIGGILGTFVAYISVRLLASTLKRQVQAYKDNSNLNRETANIYKIQQFNEQFHILFDLYRSILTEYKEIGNEPMDLTSIVKQYKLKSQDITGKDYEERINKAKEIFNEFYVTYHSVASVHFRLLYRIFQLIDDADIPDKNKTTIAKIMRCQLSPEELFLLRYNAMTENGFKMRLYINRYNLLKHLPLMSLMEFSYLSIKLDEKLMNSVNSESVIWKKNIKELLLSNTAEKDFKISYKNRYTFGVSISTSKDQCDFVLTKNSKIKLQNITSIDFATALEMFSDKELDDFLLNFAQELFLFSNFSQYNTDTSLEFIPSITENQNDKKKIISVKVKKIDESPLICSQRQMEEPVNLQRF
jgi:hypothetical protein